MANCMYQVWKENTAPSVRVGGLIEYRGVMGTMVNCDEPGTVHKIYLSIRKGRPIGKEHYVVLCDRHWEIYKDNIRPVVKEKDE